MLFLLTATEKTRPCADEDLLMRIVPVWLARSANAVAESFFFSGENVISIGTLVLDIFSESKDSTSEPNSSAIPFTISLSLAEYAQETFATAMGFNRWLIRDFLMAGRQYPGSVFVLISIPRLNILGTRIRLFPSSPSPRYVHVIKTPGSVFPSLAALYCLMKSSLIS